MYDFTVTFFTRLRCLQTFKLFIVVNSLNYIADLFTI